MFDFMKAFKSDEGFSVPKSMQEAIPIKSIYDDGIFQVSKDLYSKSYKFEDINYSCVSDEEHESSFLKYSNFLNSFSSDECVKITIANRRVCENDIENSLLLKEKQDNLDKYRIENNSRITDIISSPSHIVQDKYITISTVKNNFDDVINYFNRLDNDLSSQFTGFGSKCLPVSTTDKLNFFHNFFSHKTVLRANEQSYFNFDMLDNMRKISNFKDFLCLDCFEFKNDYFKMGDKFSRVLFLREYGTTLDDSFLSELTNCNPTIICSVDIMPIEKEKAIKMASSMLLGVDTNISNWQRRQNLNNNSSATIPYEMQQQNKTVLCESTLQELLDDLTTRNQRLFNSVVTLVHTADSLEQLDNNTKTILTKARNFFCQQDRLVRMVCLKLQQLEGINTVLPYGSGPSCASYKLPNAKRTLISEGLASLMPFRIKEIFHKNGIFYGQNAINNSMIVVDRNQLLNGNSFILGVSGSGKSFTAKNEIYSLMLSSDCDIIVIDPEREYLLLVNELGGQVINISATSENHINAMDLNSEYGDKPLILKSQFILSLCEQMNSNSSLQAEEHSIIDRCIQRVYANFIENGYTGTPPTLQDFRQELLKQEEVQAKKIALSLERFTDGSFNTFSKQTNVNTQNRLICYDILDLGEELLPIGMLVILDSILNRITRNRKLGKTTYIFIDEIYLLFKHKYSEDFLFILWKRVRKYGAFASGLTQNVEDLLQSHRARTMLSNSEFIIMLNQASSDRLLLQKLLNISKEEMKYITDVSAGEGLIKVSSSLIPFYNHYPKNTMSYKLISTKFNEQISQE